MVLFEMKEDPFTQKIVKSESSRNGERQSKNRDSRHDRIIRQGRGMQHALILEKIPDSKD
jgi:hypothetical protein